jgi:LmbE family N-acetylglucosaminyl deacetylase
MLNLAVPTGATRALTILCVGAHCDDIEIGCGGTLVEVIRKRPARVTWLICASDGARAEEARRSAALFLRDAAEVKLLIGDHPDGFLPYHGAQVKADFEALKGQIEPDLIFTHYRHDLHQDHRLASELTWNTFRDHLILEYEVPKYDGDLGNPNAFFPLSEDVCRHKVASLVQSYPSQAKKKWFAEDLFMAMLRLRGMESNSQSGLAEAFYCRKLRLVA